jgi:hypothetical protein
MVLIAIEPTTISTDEDAFITNAYASLHLRSAAPQATVEQYAACLAQVQVVLLDDGLAVTTTVHLKLTAISGELHSPGAVLTTASSTLTYSVPVCGVAPAGALPPGAYISP